LWDPRPWYSGGLGTPTGSSGFKSNDRFDVGRQLGAGGMGVVYEAYDKLTKQVVALKTLIRAEPAALYRLKNEFRSLADVSHPNLVSLYELFMEEDVCFFTMELVDGVDFIRYVTHDGWFVPGDTTVDLGAEPLPTLTAAFEIPPPAPLGAARLLTPNPDPSGALPPSPADPKRLVPALRELVDGVCALHDAGKLHRDLKPSNILVTRTGRVVILDFGLVTELEGDAQAPRGLFGTPVFVAPEQARGETLSPASDWYGVGVTLYQALTGQVPFDGDQFEVIAAKQKTDPVPPARVASGIPPEQNDLCMALLRRDAAMRPTGREILTQLAGKPGEERASSGSRPAGLIGREEHVEKLQDAFRSARAGAATAVYIRGKSGIGKSTLVRSFIRHLEDAEQAVILAGRCYERESIPYKALDGVVDSLSRYLASLPAPAAEALLPRDVAALVKIFPVLARAEAVSNYRSAARDVPDPLTLRRRAFDSLRELLGRIAAGSPLVVFIDDLHWSDTDSMALLEHLLRPPSAPALLLLATVRTDDSNGTAPLLKGILEQAGDGHFLELSVEALPKEQALRFAGSLLDRDAPGEALLEAVVRESQGNPFLIEQLARWVQGTDGESMRQITVREMIEARMRKLPGDARSALETLAIATHPISIEVVLRASRLESDPQSIVALLRSAQFLHSSGTAQRLELYHDRIREGIVAPLSQERIERMHHSLAESLIAGGFDDPEVLFEHYFSARETQAAAKYATIAAAKASAALAFDRAAAFYRFALELSGPGSDAAQELKAQLGQALANAGRPAEAAAVYLEAAEGVPSGRALDMQRRAAEQFLLGGHVDKGLEVIRTVLDRVGLRLASGTYGAFLSLLAGRFELMLRGTKFRERGASDVPSGELLRIDICWAVAAGLAMVDNIRGADFQTRHLLLALRAGEPYRIARAMAVEAGFSATSGASGRRRAQRFSNMAVALSARVGHPHAIGLARMTAGVAQFLVGEWRKALGLCGEAEEILRDQCTGVLWELTSAQNFVLGSLLYLGEFRELETRVPAMLEVASDHGNLYAATEIKTRMNPIWLASDDPERAKREVAEALQIWSQKGFHRQHYNALLAEAQIALYSGDGRAALDTVLRNWPALRRTMLLRIQVLRIEALFLKARAVLAIAEAEPAHSLAFVKEAERLARAIERENMLWSDPLACVVRAVLASLREDHTAAAARLSDAIAGFDRAGMALHAAAARWRLGQISGGPESADLIAKASGDMTGQGIRNPARMVRMLAPGFPDPRLFEPRTAARGTT
jgi:eukaryotic-like serine/threonine-protein kinase